jgi:hypothetical protein
MTIRLVKMGCLALFCVGAALAQEYEIGGLGGAGFMRGIGVTGARGSASTGLAPGFSAGMVVGNDMYPHLSGEIRYLFRDSNLQLSSGGSRVTFSAVSHLVHYDLLFFPSARRSKARPFVAGGAGARVFRGTGRETAFQPLIEYAALTRTQEVKPVISVGAGIRMDLSPRLRFRAEFRDYLSPFPKQLIAPVGGAKIAGWLHDVMPLAGISYVF